MKNNMECDTEQPTAIESSRGGGGGGGAWKWVYKPVTIGKMFSLFGIQCFSNVFSQK